MQQHKIKMDSRYFENVLSVVAGDTGRRIQVQLLDTNGMVQNTTGLNLRLNALIAGKSTFTDATLVDAATGKYQLDLSNGMFLAPGDREFQWQITDSSGKKLNSFAFTGNVGKNITEGGVEATNFYLNIDSLKAMQDDLVNGTFHSEALETNIAEKLEALEETYAPRLTEVATQLAQIKNDNVVDLVLFMGQSNMAGRGVADEATVLDDGEGYEFKAITDPTKLYKAVEPFGRLENNPNGITETTKTGGMVTSIMKTYFQQTGIPIVGVSASRGGTSINDWLPNTVYYNDAVQRYTLARNWLQENGYTIRNQFVVWCQGETDGDNSMSKDEYITKFGTLSGELLTVQQMDKIFMVRIGNHREVATRYDTIIEAQTEIGKAFEDVVTVSLKFAEMAELGLMKDSYHYTQTAYNIVGLESGVNMGYYVKNLIKPYMEDPEYNNVYIPFVQNNYVPYNRTIFPFNSEGENGLEINDFGVLSGGKITTTTLDKGAKRLDAPFKVTSDYDWTIEAHIKNTTTDSRAVIMSAGASTGGFLNLPNAIPTPFRLRDLNNTFTVTATLPTGFDGTIPHSYAVTSRNGKIRMYVDFIEVPTTVTGTLIDFYFDRLLGGYSTTNYDFVGECYYIALTEGKALQPAEMHRE